MIGGGALVVLAFDLLYASTRWSGAFPRSFLIALGCLAACVVVAFALRLSRPLGSDRRHARWNQRGVNVVLVVLIIAFIEIGNREGGNDAGLLLGAIAGLAAGFAAFTLVDVVRKRL